METGSELVYRFEARLDGMYPLGVFPEGIRFHNGFEGRVTDGPFAGGRIFGLDRFLLRPDGVGVVDAPEVIETDRRRVSVQVHAYVVPPDGLVMPPLEVVAAPGFEFPDVPFRVTGAGFVRAADPELAWLNREVVRIEGSVSLVTGELVVEARTMPAPVAAR